MGTLEWEGGEGGVSARNAYLYTFLALTELAEMSQEINGLD